MTLQPAHQQVPRSQFGRIVDFAFAGFARFLSLLFFFAALYVWARVVGFWPGANYRFDTMSPMMQVYSIVLAVVLPVASVGMWTTLPWGRVIWFLLIGFQTVMAFRFLHVMDHAEFIILFHAITLGLYVVFQILLFFIDKKA